MQNVYITLSDGRTVQAKIGRKQIRKLREQPDVGILRSVSFLARLRRILARIGKARGN